MWFVDLPRGELARTCLRTTTPPDGATGAVAEV